MAHIRSYALKLFGTVAYSDGSKGMFEATTDNTIGRSLVAVPKDATGPLNDFALLNRDKHASILGLFADTTWAVTLTTTPPVTSKTVTDFVAFLSGLVAYDNNTKASFAVEWFKGNVDFRPADTASVGAALRADDLAVLNSLLKAVDPAGSVA
jgi:hypothetical protein